ncbi:hypothetical protein K474DRAFT_483725 [Panus rudis PR-1116 ss-1]|nr:hypothetical protein K474DRAFT_483725 [Panus rudis PR-1116 ss-1]
MDGRLHATLARANITLSSTTSLAVLSLRGPSSYLIRQAGRSLRELVILGDREALSEGIDISLGHLSGLRSLYHQAYDIDLLWFFNYDATEDLLWQELDRILNTPAFRFLRNLNVISRKTASPGEFELFAMQHLPHCFSRGIVSYGYRDRF